MAVAPTNREPPLPVPPIPPPPDPTADPLSPTTMVMNYLKSKGMQPNNPNYAQAVRSALEQNSRDPTTIPGLVNSTPSTEAEDQAAMAAARGGARGGKPNPFANPINPTWETVNNSSPTTSAAPTTDASMQWGPGAAALATAILGGGAYAGSKLFQQARAPVPGASAGPPPDVAPSRPGALPGELDYTPMQPPSTEPRAPDRGPGTVDYTAMPPEGNNLVDQAISRAVGNPAAPPPPDLAGVRPIPGAATMPPRGPTDTAPIPFNSQSPRRAPTPEELAALRASRTSSTLRGFAQPTAEDLVRAAGRVVRR